MSILSSLAFSVSHSRCSSEDGFYEVARYRFNGNGESSSSFIVASAYMRWMYADLRPAEAAKGAVCRMP